ncbi:MAG: prepilin-type N-terminal cleavage/methylation domain-containing protein, partial [Clostridium paraputrificum]
MKKGYTLIELVAVMLI